MNHRIFLSIALLLGACFLPSKAEAAPQGEIIIISGGPALRSWENLRIEDDRHDRWWGNFIRPARVRMESLRLVHGDYAPITWLVHRSSYSMRAREEGRPYPDFVRSVQEKVNCKLVWYDTGDDVIRYINKGQNRWRTKIAHLEYYGHSNKYCWMFDYSSEVLGASTSYLHVNDLSKLKGNAFHREAFVKSWGCHTGEAMSGVWRKYTGVPMIGALGKTDYSAGYHVVLSPGGRWTR